MLMALMFNKHKLVCLLRKKNTVTSEAAVGSKSWKLEPKMPEEVLVKESTPATGVRVVTLNRPGKRNALSRDLISQFLQQLSEAAADSDIKVIIITGHGPYFSCEQVKSMLG